MTDNDRDWFADQMEGLGLTFDKEVTDPLGEIYFRALSSYSVDQIENAINLAVTSCKFFPKPAELIEFISGSPDDRAAIAWEVAVNAFRKAGYWQSVVFEDGLIGSALITVFGGWVGFSEAVHNLSNEMVASKRKEFLIAYRNAQRMRKVINYLPGHHESENRNTIAKWNRDQFQESYKQNVYIASGNGGHFIEAAFDRSTGELIGDLQALISQEPVRLKLPAKPKALLAESSSPIPPEEGAKIVADAVGQLVQSMRMPEERKPMDRAELVTRIKELREQARALGAEESDKSKEANA